MAAKNKKGKKDKHGKKDRHGKKDKHREKDKKDKKGHKHHAHKKSKGTGQEFNASDFIMYPRSELDRIDHHHINCILKSSRLQSEDTHEEMLMKHEAIKNLMNKMKQKANYSRKDMKASKKTESELNRLTKEQEKTLEHSQKLENKRHEQEHKDMQEALQVRLHEVEKCERQRLD